MRKLNELTIVTPFSWTVSLFQCAKQRQKDSKDRECYTGNNPILHNAHSFSTCNLNKISDNRTMMRRTKRYYFFCGSLSNFADGWLFFYFAGTVYDQLSVVFSHGELIFEIFNRLACQIPHEKHKLPRTTTDVVFRPMWKKAVVI